ncbi:hypothetical protein SK128_010011 [Halocaridina rubra]|uniref:Uncharacterized protein n=1 Tax=Halocaridina rubra TaxID=373956 RepID=A0AAN8XS85_HALRR
MKERATFPTRWTPNLLSRSDGWVTGIRKRGYEYIHTTLGSGASENLSKEDRS